MLKPEEIVKDKKYETRGGSIARVICTDRKNTSHPVVALIKDANGVEFAFYLTKQGFLYGPEDTTNVDLIEEYVAWRNEIPEGGLFCICSINRNQIDPGVVRRIVYYNENARKYLDTEGVYWPYAKLITSQDNEKINGNFIRWKTRSR